MSERRERPTPPSDPQRIVEEKTRENARLRRDLERSERERERLRRG